MASFPDIFNCSVAVIGLGYVGLPLALQIDGNKKCLKSGKDLSRRVIGFDINQERLSSMKTP